LGYSRAITAGNRNDETAVLSQDNSKEYTMSIFAELWDFLQERKKYWLMPIFLVLLVFGGLILMVQGSAVAPFIYTLF